MEGLHKNSCPWASTVVNPGLFPPLPKGWAGAFGKGWIASGVMVEDFGEVRGSEVKGSVVVT